MVNLWHTIWPQHYHSSGIAWILFEDREEKITLFGFLHCSNWIWCPHKRIDSRKKSACLSEELDRDVFALFLAVRACSFKIAEYLERHCDPVEEVKVQVHPCSNLKAAVGY